MERFNVSEEALAGGKRAWLSLSKSRAFLLALVVGILITATGLIVHYAGKGAACSDEPSPLEVTLAPAAQVCFDDCNGKVSTTVKPPVTTTNPTTSPPGNQDLRLPTNIVPRHYVVELKPDIYGDNSSKFTFEGTVSITVECLKDTSMIYIHSKNLTVHPDQVSLSEEGGASVPKVESVTEDKNRQFLVISLSDDLRTGINYTVHLNFSAALSTSLDGIYYSKYTEDVNGVDTLKYVVATQMEPTHARMVFPCFDEPELKATFDVILRRKSWMKSLSNMPIEREETGPDDWRADVYQRSVKMSTYLLAFVICDFDHEEQILTNGTEFRVWARKSAINDVKYALDVGAKIIEYFEEYFDIPFPLPKQDMIALPDFGAEAMENWGLITYRETALLYNPKVSSTGNKQWVASVVSHELAHQWFGNLVSPAWWDDLWLNEGFASFVEYLGVDYVEKDWQMMTQIVMSDVHRALSLDGLASSHPIIVPVDNPDEIGSIFDAISYAKAGSVLRMAQNCMGAETFKRGLQSYLKKHQYGSATHEDLWNALQTQAVTDNKVLDPDLTVGQLMDLYTKQMGYPVITVSKAGDGKVKVTQRHFLLDPDQEPDPKYENPYGYKWVVPFTFASDHTVAAGTQFSAASSNVTYLFKNEETEETIAAPYNRWIVANVQQFGFYRVNYDAELWEGIFDQLNDDHTVIDEINRAQIIDDIFSLASGGDYGVTVTNALESIAYLSKETSYFPWDAAVSKLGSISNRIRNTEAYGNFKIYMSKLLKTLYDDVDWEFSENMDHIAKYKRILGISYGCSYDISDCRERAQDLFSEWMRTSKNPIDADIKSTIYCRGVRDGGQTEWDFIYQQFQESGDAGEKSKLLSALGCTQEGWLLNRLLRYSLDDTKIRKQDATAAISTVAYNNIGRYLAWDFFKENWDYMLNDYGEGSFSFGSMVSAVTSRFVKQSDLDELNAFISNQTDLKSVERAFQQAVEGIEANIKFLQKNEQSITTYLEEKVGSGNGEVENIRLPRSILPYYYDISLKVDIYTPSPEDFRFEGSVTISMTCHNATNVITIHSIDMDLSDQMLLTKADGSNTNITIVSTTYDIERQFVHFTLAEDLIEGSNYTLTLTNFTGQIKDELVGLYYSVYYEMENGVSVPHYIAVTQLEPLDARRMFPCFDEPDMKAKFKLTVFKKNNMTTISNMRQSRTNVTSISEPGWEFDEYEESPTMSTYLLAIVVCDFTSKEDSTGNSTVRVWARPSAIGQVDYAVYAGRQIMDSFGEYFDIPFPLDKQDMVAVPDFAAGAMENWGLIIYKETALLYDEGSSSLADKQGASVIISHEIAHQWFGNLVSPVWWDDIWLNEGFATFVEYLGVDMIHPEWMMFDQIVTTDVQNVMAFDGLANSHPVYSEVNTPAEINEIFDPIAYAKGGSLIRMIRDNMGAEPFRQGLENYLKGKSYGNAAHDDLWRYLASATNDTIDVKTIMDSWTLQMGYPVVFVNRTGPGSFTVSQQHFLLDPESQPDPNYPSSYGYKWEIPLTYKSDVPGNASVQTHLYHWNDSAEVEILLNTTNYVLVNVDQVGYYRVNYDSKSWDAIIEVLDNNHETFDLKNRAQIMDDAFNLARAGKIPFSRALSTTQYLVKEKDYVPWVSASVNLGYIDSVLQTTEAYGDFSEYMTSLISPLYSSMGWEKSKNDTQLDVYTRAIAIRLACRYDVTNCRSRANSMFQDWMESPANNKIDPDLKNTVYCQGVASGGQAEWDFVFEQRQTANNAAEKQKLLMALSCTSQEWLLRRMLQYSLEPSKIRKQDAVGSIVAVSSNTLGGYLAWNFLQENFRYIMDDFLPALFGASKVAGVVEHFTTEFQLKQVIDFLRRNPDQGSASRAFSQAIEKIEANVRFLADYQAPLAEWLEEITSGGTDDVDVRLPKTLIPYHYELELAPDMYSSDNSSFTFKGRVKVFMHCKNNTDVITMHLVNLTISEIRLFKINTSTEAESLLNSDLVYDLDDRRQFVNFHPPSTLMMGEKYALEMNFIGPLKGDLKGLYYSSYTVRNATGGEENRYIATSQLQATDARKTFPCFDAPEFKATFHVTIHRQPWMQSIGNAAWNETKNSTLETGWVADEYEDTLSMSTYLLAFVVCDFNYIERDTSDGRPVRVWAKNVSIEAGEADYALNATIHILEYFEKYFNISYPLNKLDMIAIPDFAAGAMENWGLITYRETALLYKEGVSAAVNKQRVAVVISHELAHQWFGNLVSPAWWDDLWLNEGFASFVEYLGVDNFEPTWQMMSQIVVLDVEDVLEPDGLATSHPISVEVSDPDQITELFDRISYGKGASIIRMAQNTLGEETFKAGLTNYLNNKSYDVATHNDLWNFLGAQAAVDNKMVDVKEFMDTWTLQMGYPVVSVSARSNGAVTVTQDRFLYDKTKATDDGEFGYKWEIPITFVTDRDTNFTSSPITWLHKNDASVDLQVGDSAQMWVVNLQQYGYYRVNYDTDNWKALAEALRTTHMAIDDKNRAQIMDDAINLARAGLLNISVAMETTRYLDKETEYVPWHSALHNLNYLDKIMESTPSYGLFEGFMKMIIEPLYQAVNWNNVSAIPHIEKLVAVYGVTYGCKYDVLDCRSQATALFSSWMTSGNNTIPPDLKSAVYCNAIREGGEAEWDWAFKAFKETDTASEKVMLLRGMACSETKWILQRMLNYALDPSKIKTQDSLSAMNYVASNPLGRYLAWGFVQDNWDKIFAEYSVGISFDGIVGITNSFTTRRDLQELKDFISTRADLGSAARAFTQATERIEVDIQFSEENADKIAAWLQTP